MHLSQEKTINKSEKVWYFIGVYIRNRTLRGHLEIWNFSSCVEKIFHEWAQQTSEIFFNTQREILYLHVVMYYPLCMLCCSVMKQEAFGFR